MKRYLLVEGRTDLAFVKALCTDMHVDQDERIQIIDIGGLGALKGRLEAMSPELKRGEKIAVVLDADNDYAKRKEEIVSIIEGRDISFFLIPNDRDAGNLETLLLSTIDDHVILSCFDEYTACLKSEGMDTSTVDDKAKLYAYTKIALGETPEKSFEDEGNWNFEHPNFQNIKQFLSDFFTA